MMSALMVKVRGLYFEEFIVGQSIVSMGRTITEADVYLFAGLSGDFNTIHTDAEYSNKGPFGQRVAHGILGLAIASGLAVRTGVMEGTVIAFREIDEWKFIKPVFIGDTVHVVLEVSETKAIARIGGGAVNLGVSLQNQHDETVMKGTWRVLVAAKPAGS